MSSTKPNEYYTLVDVFKGTGWEDCNEFIRAIRASAWREGKQRDMAWMADYAALQFSHAALAWHSRLPPDVRQDWSKLENALLDRWPPPEGIDESQIHPTPPAAAPSIQSNNLNANRPHQGVLRVISDGSNEHFYVKAGSEFCSLTRDVNEALQVRCYWGDETVVLELASSSSYLWLAVGWWSSPPPLDKGSKEYASVRMITNQMKPSQELACPWQIMTCTVSANGVLNPTWRIGTKRQTLGLFVEYPKLRLAADPATYSRSPEYKRSEKATLAIESVN